MLERDVVVVKIFKLKRVYLIEFVINVDFIALNKNEGSHVVPLKVLVYETDLVVFVVLFFKTVEVELVS